MFLEAYAEKAIAGWKGLKVKHLPVLLPVDISTMDAAEEVEYSMEDAIEPGYIDELIEADQLYDVALVKAKDLGTLAHPQYDQTKKIDQEDVIKKISSGIDQIEGVLPRQSL